MPAFCQDTQSNRMHSIRRDQIVSPTEPATEGFCPAATESTSSVTGCIYNPLGLQGTGQAMGKASRRKSAVAVQRVLDTARNAIQTVAGAKEFCVRADLPQEEKISHALSALLETEGAEGSSLAEYRAALAFIVIRTLCKRRVAPRAAVRFAPRWPNIHGDSITSARRVPRRCYVQ